MDSSQDYQEITVLIPGYSIEDLPTDLNERRAASLLNAFAVSWHPLLLAHSRRIPAFRQADSLSLPTAQSVVIVPQDSLDWLGHDWQEKLESCRSLVISDCEQREDYLRAVETAFASSGSTVPDEITRDFLALGTNHLLLMLLSRRMHHFGDPDSYLLETEAFAAAAAAVSGDTALAREHLRRCFECLQDCREQFYPLQVFLLDVCLPSESTAAAQVRQVIERTPDLNLLASVQDLVRFDREDSGFLATLKSAVAEQQLSLLTGHLNEVRTPLTTLGAVYDDIQLGLNWLHQKVDVNEVHWARRRFGVTSSMPALLEHFHFQSALHVVLDDGLYPDREYGHFAWQGNDGTTIPATSRIPLAIDSASSLLRFADRMTESMQEDTSAVMFLARLPEVQTPWLEDLKIGAAYAPVLGRFVTVSEFVSFTKDQTSPTRFDAGEYLGPFLIQSAVFKTEPPVSSPADLYCLRRQADSLGMLKACCKILKADADPDAVSSQNLRRDLNTIEADQSRTDVRKVKDQPQPATDLVRLRDSFRNQLEDECRQSLNHLRNRIPTTESTARGLLIQNTVPWNRQHFVAWPSEFQMPAAVPGLTACWRQNGQLFLEAELPPTGFLWLHEAVADKPAVQVEDAKGRPLAERLLLRNRFFEVLFNENTGGISSVTYHNQRSNRLSQQVSLRYDLPKKIRVEDEEVSVSYAVTKLLSSTVVSSGPLTGSIENTCEVICAQSEKSMGTFRQITTVHRTRPALMIDLQFDDTFQVPAGNPWMTYVACRFAWENSVAAITRGVLGQASGFRGERFESPDYIEVADSDQRLLIIPHGRPYHRRTSDRTLDSLLLLDGETSRSFRFTVEFDQPYPMRPVLEAVVPCLEMPTDRVVPSKFASAWILSVSAKNVQATPLATAAGEPETSESSQEDGPQQTPQKIRLLLQETEGRTADCLIRTARQPVEARLCQADGTTLQKLNVTAQGVLVEIQRFQIRELELTF